MADPKGSARHRKGAGMERKVAIITGAGSGIGLATAKLLHTAGCSVVGVGRDIGKLAALEKAIFLS